MKGQENEENGSTWIPLKNLPNGKKVLEKCEKGDLVQKTINKEVLITLPYFAELEEKAAQSILRNLTKRCKNFSEVEIVPLIQEFEEVTTKKVGFPYKLAKEQKEGVVTLLTNNFAILTGGPGTGKTTVLNCVAYIIKKINPRAVIAFTAPTGKAARRVTESTHYPAMTIQKKIGDKGDNLNLIKMSEDYVICDEVSMLDIETFTKALSCISPWTHFYMVGDVDQLPSVGPGAVLRDCIDSGVIPICQLEQTFRQDNDSVLFKNIQNIKKGLYAPLLEGPDFHRFNENGKIVDTLIQKYLDGVKKYGLDNVVTLTPYRKEGFVCSEKLNKLLQKKLNPEGKYIRTTIAREDGHELDITFRVGDPVMQLVNREMVANGDVGSIIEISGEKITVQYYDCTVDYYPENYDDLDLAYALSIYKSQGSEYKYVVIPMLREHKNLDRNLCYTGVTRAKKECVILADNDVLSKACKTQSSWLRYTCLAETIKQKIIAATIKAATR